LGVSLALEQGRLAGDRSRQRFRIFCKPESKWHEQQRSTDIVTFVSAVGIDHGELRRAARTTP
jgi:hypothetical protein